jgi:N-acetylmuramic acid 6-phosphate (MurNAc-6-P) etherase
MSDRQRERDYAIRRGAVMAAGGNTRDAAQQLRRQAEDHLEAALAALRHGASAERARQLMNGADRRLRLAAELCEPSSDGGQNGT